MISIAQMLSDKYRVYLSEESSAELNFSLVKKEYKREDIILKLGETSKDIYIIEKAWFGNFTIKTDGIYQNIFLVKMKSFFVLKVYS